MYCVPVLLPCEIYIMSQKRRHHTLVYYLHQTYTDTL